MTAYLDHASTTPPLPEAMAAMTRVATEHFADPSRLYDAARRARIELDRARAAVAAALGARPDEIVFTSGGTESCNLAIAGAARAARAARRPLRAVVTAVEHTAVLHAARALDGFEVVEVGVDGTGRVDLDAWRDAVRGAGLASIQWANPEVGTLQPVAEAAALARAEGAIVHTDACAAAGHVQVSVDGLDLVSVSSHKAYGPKGVGALWVRTGVRLRPSAVGDDRERGRRAGMEDLGAIAGFAAAMQARAPALPAEAERLRAWTDSLRVRLPERVPDLIVHGHPTERLPGLVSFSAMYVEGEALLLGLDQAGFAVHSGSSCTSSTQEPSHVLAAMGAITHGSIRVSLGRSTTAEEVEGFLDALPPIVERARALTR